MSMSEVAIILKRAIEDESYRTLIFSGSNKALEQYNLTDSERSMLIRIGSDTYASTKRGLVNMHKMMIDAEKYEPE